MGAEETVFPKKLYVIREEGAAGRPYYYAFEKPADVESLGFEMKTPIGVYVLEAQRDLRTVSRS